jgi:hypothetical protein
MYVLGSFRVVITVRTSRSCWGRVVVVMWRRVIDPFKFKFDYLNDPFKFKFDCLNMSLTV